MITNSDDPYAVQSIDGRDVPDYVRRFYSAHSNQKLLWIGHSYGGWLSLKTLIALQEQNISIPPPDLFTIDPISKRNCSVTSPLGCSSAPTDVSEAEYLRLGESVGEWMNFYQRKTPVVRSSPVRGARSNIEIAVGHTRIDNHPLVWQNITSTLAASSW